MLYSKFIFHAKEMTIKQLDNGTWYLDPEWKDIVCREVESDINNIEDSYLTDWWDVENVLHLEVERRNAQDSKTKDVINWLYELINSTVEPAMLEEENNYVKAIIEDMKTNHDLNKENPEI